MNEKQEKAIINLKRALNAAGKVGLRGGVFESTFCIYPVDSTVVPEHVDGLDFFEQVKKYGEALHTPLIYLDGGAGV